MSDDDPTAPGTDGVTDADAGASTGTDAATGTDGTSGTAVTDATVDIDATSAGATSPSRGRLRRRDAVLAGLIVAGALFGITRAAWLHASVPDLAGGSTAVAVGGDQAAPAVVALAVVALATSLAMAISSSVVRFVTGPVLVVCGLGAAASALLVRADPEGHATSAVVASTGLLGSGAEVTVTPWSLVALVPSVLLVALGVLVLWRGRGWRRSRRYDRDAGPHGSAPSAAVGAPADTPEHPFDDPSAAWDALSRGEDPTWADQEQLDEDVDTPASPAQHPEARTP